MRVTENIYKLHSMEDKLYQHHVVVSSGQKRKLGL
jgi:hypothetical protein